MQGVLGCFSRREPAAMMTKCSTLRQRAGGETHLALFRQNSGVAGFNLPAFVERLEKSAQA